MFLLVDYMFVMYKVLGLIFRMYKLGVVTFVCGFSTWEEEVGRIVRVIFYFVLILRLICGI